MCLSSIYRSSKFLGIFNKGKEVSKDFSVGSFNHIWLLLFVFKFKHYFCLFTSEMLKGYLKYFF